MKKYDSPVLPDLLGFTKTAPRISRAIDQLKAASHSGRQNLLNLLAVNEEMAVTDIFISLRIPQPIASIHLSILREADLVRVRVDGKARYYSVNRERLAEMAELAGKIGVHQ